MTGDIAEYLANVSSVRAKALNSARPPPKLSLSAWADEYFYLSAESAAEPGRWHTLPYQRGIMDAFTDRTVEQVSVMKSARVGWTKIVNALVGYSIHQDPCPILIVQPTVDDAKGYSKEEIAPMLRDCPELAKIVFEDAEENGPKDSGNTILHKRFPGGVLSMVGANSGAGFRRVSRKRVLFDEVDGYPPSAGSDGDQIKLGVARTQYYWDRKIGAGSTPLVAGASRIEKLFEAGDQRRYYVPCPQCQHMAPLVFSGNGGHRMEWPEGKPREAFFSCQKNGCVIEHKQKRDIVAAGEWRAHAEFNGKASFHIWAAYSYAPNASWGQLAEEFLDAKSNPEKLRTFVNTVLGETWKEQGEAPDWQRLFLRREAYEIGTVPAGVIALTAGVDVQKDRVVWEVVGWGAGKESWSIDCGVIPMDTAAEVDWLKVDDLLNRTYRTGSGTEMTILCLAVDSGYNTQAVYNWTRRHPMSRVIAVKGSSSASTLISVPTKVDVTSRGVRIARGASVWPVGVDVAKSELYGWLKLPEPDEGSPYPAGYCHFPQYDEEFFKQLTGEHLVSRVNERTGFTVQEWHLQPGRENHFLDARVYARAVVSLAGLDRMRSQAPAAAAPTAPVSQPRTAPAAPRPQTQRRSDSRFSGGRAKNWFKR